MNLSFKELYEEHNGKVFNVALNYTQRVEDAEEITQDVFVSIHNNLSSFNNESNISTWIYRIAVNKSLDYIKAKKRRKRFAFVSSLFSNVSDEIIHEPVDFNHPGIELENKEKLETLLKQVNKLPPKQKTALILHKIERNSQIEVAEIMQITPKAVESLIQRAKTNLLKILSENEG